MTTKAGWQHWLGFSPTAGSFNKIPNIQEATLNLTSEVDDETSWDTAGWMASWPGIRSGTISGTIWKDTDDASGYYDDLVGYFDAGTKFYVQYLSEASGDGIQAECHLSTWNESAPARGRSEVSFEIQLTGTFTRISNGA